MSTLKMSCFINVVCFVKLFNINARVSYQLFKIINIIHANILIFVHIHIYIHVHAPCYNLFFVSSACFFLILTNTIKIRSNLFQQS